MNILENFTSGVKHLLLKRLHGCSWSQNRCHQLMPDEGRKLDNQFIQFVLNKIWVWNGYNEQNLVEWKKNFPIVSSFLFCHTRPRTLTMLVGQRCLLITPPNDQMRLLSVEKDVWTWKGDIDSLLLLNLKLLLLRYSDPAQFQILVL